MKKLIFYLLFFSLMVLSNQKSHCNELNKKDSIIYIQDSTSSNKFKYDSKIDPLIINFIKSILENPDKLRNFEENFPELKCQECIFNIYEQKEDMEFYIDFIKDIKKSSVKLNILQKNVDLENSINLTKVFNFYFLKDNPKDYFWIDVEGYYGYRLICGFFKNRDKFEFYVFFISMMIN